MQSMARLVAEALFYGVPQLAARLQLLHYRVRLPRAPMPSVIAGAPVRLLILWRTLLHLTLHGCSHVTGTPCVAGTCSPCAIM